MKLLVTSTNWVLVGAVLAQMVACGALRQIWRKSKSSAGHSDCSCSLTRGWNAAIFYIVYLCAGLLLAALFLILLLRAFLLAAVVVGACAFLTAAGLGVVLERWDSTG